MSGQAGGRTLYAAFGNSPNLAGYMSHGALPGEVYASGDGDDLGVYAAEDQFNPDGWRAHISSEAYPGWCGGTARGRGAFHCPRPLPPPQADALGREHGEHVVDGRRDDGQRLPGRERVLQPLHGARCGVEG